MENNSLFLSIENQKEIIIMKSDFYPLASEKMLTTDKELPKNNPTTLPNITPPTIAKTLEAPITYNKDLSKEYQNPERLENPHQFMAYTTRLKEIGNIHNKTVLDLACGSGDSSEMLIKEGAKEVVGIEISESMLNNTTQNNKITYILADASIPKPYRKEPFDKVVGAFLLNYASSLEKLKGMLKNVAKNLKKNEQFITITISPDHPIVEP
jgi:ubiquinone/menaquinone biosynthesis C-methylase UbiE